MRASLLVILLGPTLAWAQVPARLGYQGRLLQANGSPESLPLVTMSFTLFDASTGGNARWAETQLVGLSNGYYSVQLGASTPFPPGLFDGSDLYLEIAVGGADAGLSPLSPRQRLSSVAYALRAAQSVSLSGGPVDATTVSVNGQTVIDSSGMLTGPAAAHTHDAADVVSGTLSLSRIPQGTGSGLDADLLDGLDSSAFARSSILSAPGTINQSTNPVDWTQLKNVPSALAAGTVLSTVAHDSSLLGDGTSSSVLGVNPNEVQVRVTGVCAPGSSIRSIDSTGAVVCQDDVNSGGTVTQINTGSGLTGGPITSSGTLAIAVGGVTSSHVEDGTLSFDDLGQNSATPGQVIKWNGTRWVAADDAAPPLQVARSFINWSVAGSTSSASWTVLGTLEPLVAGNRLTLSHLRVEGNTTSASVNAFIRYRVTYADGTLYNSPEFTVNSNLSTALVDASYPFHSAMHDTITSIVIEGRAGSSSATGRVTASGFEDSASSLQEAKSFSGRTASGSTANTAWTEVASLEPLVAGSHMTVTHLRFQGNTTSASVYAYMRYRLIYADGQTVTSPEYRAGSNLSTVFVDTSVPVHERLRDTLVRIAVDARAGTSSGTARVTATGFEVLP